MMKKLLVLMLVLGMASSAWAAMAWFTVSPEKQSYAPSDIITIGIVADFYVGQMTIEDVTTDNDGTASNPLLHTLLQVPLFSHGDIINEGGILISDPVGQIAGYLIEEGVPPGETVWSFDYHVPDVPESTIITIDTIGLILADAWYMDYVESIEPLEIHVVPEPMTIALMGLGGLFLRRRKK